jgi:hypothetical protein
MRPSIAVALLLLVAWATAGVAQEPATAPATSPTTSAPAPKPDYSRDALLRFVATATDDHPPIPRQVQWGLGTVEFPLFGTRFRVAWLPFLPTLNPIGRHASINPMVDPFEMTGIVDLPMMKRPSSAERRELRRIERRLRRKKSE